MRSKRRNRLLWTVHFLDQMFAIIRSLIIIGPELDHFRDLLISDGKKGYNPRFLHSVSNGHIPNGLHIISYKSVNRKLPTTMRRLLLVHRRKIVPTANALIRLGPFENKVI